MVPTDKYYERNPDFVYRKIVEEAVLVPIHQNIADMDCIYTLNGVGAFVWEHLKDPMPRSTLQQAMLENYEAEPGVLVDDLDRFLSEMTAIGALREV